MWLEQQHSIRKWFNSIFFAPSDFIAREVNANIFFIICHVAQWHFTGLDQRIVRNKIRWKSDEWQELRSFKVHIGTMPKWMEICHFINIKSRQSLYKVLIDVCLNKNCSKQVKSDTFISLLYFYYDRSTIFPLLGFFKTFLLNLHQQFSHYPTFGMFMRPRVYCKEMDKKCIEQNAQCVR